MRCILKRDASEKKFEAMNVNGIVNEERYVVM